MAYTALYRKFRPKVFKEMVGQEHITKTLKNQIIAGRIGHAYLFNGGRGTGKTSAAKILARAINCLNPIDGEPCNKCETCKSILSGANTDVVEMDAASNNSVEDIRTIREEVNFLPTSSKYRVYIIDEVHMLSTGAFNALLKTLEEPPEHVKFILATTEPQKLPATILSRCQRFDFKKISNVDIVKRLKIVCKESNIQITEAALNIIAILSEGAMRDALSILERCLQDGLKNINEDNIKDLVGIPKITYIQDIIDGVLTYNVEKVLNTLENVVNEGKDVNNLTWELIKYVKDLLVYKTTSKVDLYSENEIIKLKELSQKVEKNRLLNLIYELSELQNNIKTSSQKLIIFQAGIIKLCNKQIPNTDTNLERRITLLEEKLGKGIKIKNNNVENTNKTNIENNIIQENNFTGKKSNDIKKEQNQLKTIVSQGPISKEWHNIVNGFKTNGKMMLFSNLANTNAVEINDMTIGIEFPNGLNSFGKTVLEKIDNKSEIENKLSIACGKQMHVKYIDLTQKNNNIKTSKNNFENIINGLEIPFDVIE